MSEPLLRVRALRIGAGKTVLVDEVDLEIRAGEIVTLFGPSGAGKTTLATALAGSTAAGLTVSGRIDRRDGVRVGYLPQDAAATLNPARRIGTALAELDRLRARRSGLPRPGRRDRRRHLATILTAAAFTVDPADLDALLRRYPFEFSGGERARLALAQVLTFDPDVLVVDEPTVGLDPIARATLLSGLAGLRQTGTAIVLVTHDAQAAEAISDRVLFVRDGRVSSTGDLPRTAAPTVRPSRPATAPVLRVRELSVSHRDSPTIRALDLDLRHGELLGMIGMSGAGKSTIGRCVAGLAQPDHGEIRLGDDPLPPLRRRSRAQIAAVQYVWQESAASFDPRRPVLDQVAATALRLRGLRRADARDEALELLRALDLDAEQARRHPAGLSGGQLQRAALARALGAHPRVLVCDEITTALDQPLAQRILDHLDDYRQRTGAAILLISHDLSALFARADRIAVLDDGQLTEIGTPADVLAPPVAPILAGLHPVPDRESVTAGRIEAWIPRT
ncbi:ATP-binding cassette domain-containing protein [Nocardia sp. AG03]|uniref:ABC transporter ATP-binding protein n=1 Tax=Nocardia sp. AG03 TaxID=3025312 RepID=UPI0024182CF5|nr:ATP-binding cassette domain-containing protein [Nocardia sp. AG03]